ncbi:hypothetical protein MFLO_05760 [Listeria floridensis FSL S10-1187]|uniref:DUF4352 domain-containing protein n=1 Tax=Listeria floridensis FSL S10-1187 TaxID=1265817 RepID=A0ABN0RGT2_9LIST|nr:DUF5068 domain-containing protein [Listeria floridensis]EUJ33075.1 hypothetical protein MFLO_05760 [Listeria floridensis FSL S10-1187]
MKKWMSAIMILMVAILVAACGSDKSAEKETKTEPKQEQKAKKEEKQTTEKKTEEDTAANSEGKQTETPKTEEPKSDASESKQDSSTASSEKKAESSTKQTPKAQIAAPAISKAAFSTSNVAPVTGGKVTTVYGNYSSSFIKDFGSLTIRVNQYKVEKVENPTKTISVYSPESYMQKGGYVITLYFSIFNQTKQNLTYKPEQISLAGNSTVTGGSLDNFVPAKYHIKGSASDPYVFAPEKTAEGFVTYMLDEAKFQDLKANPRIAVPNPSKMDNKAVKGDDAVASIQVQ